jgi:hypothetical protein
MLRALTLTLIAGALSAIMVVDAGALPLAQGKHAATAGDTILVRDGCGLGRHFSRRLRRCVDDGPRAIIRDVVRPKVCPPGFHWSVGRGRCVRN